MNERTRKLKQARPMIQQLRRDNPAMKSDEMASYLLDTMQISVTRETIRDWCARAGMPFLTKSFSTEIKKRAKKLRKSGMSYRVITETLQKEFGDEAPKVKSTVQNWLAKHRPERPKKKEGESGTNWGAVIDQHVEAGHSYAESVSRMLSSWTRSQVPANEEPVMRVVSRTKSFRYKKAA